MNDYGNEAGIQMRKNSRDAMKNIVTISYLFVLLCVGNEIWNEIVIQAVPPKGPRPFFVFIIEIGVLTAVIIAFTINFFSFIKIRKAQLQSEDALEKSREWYKALFENSTDAILISRPSETGGDCPIIDCNETACRMWNISKEELLRHGMSLFLDKQNDEHLSVALEKLRSEKLLRFITANPLAGESESKLEIIINLLSFADGEYILGVCRDITEREQTREALLTTETRLGDMANLLPNYICELDLDMKVKYINKSAYEAFGYDDRDIQEGFSILRLIHPDDRERAVENLRKLLDGDHKEPNEYRLITKEGREITAIVASSPRIEHGKLCGILGCVTDISDRKQAEEALRISEAKYRTLFESSMDGIFLIEMAEDDPEGHFVDCNEAACRMNGYSREEIIGQKARFLTPPSSWVDEKYYDDLRDGRRIYQEFAHIRKDGTVIHVESVAGVFTINNKEYRLGLDREITSRKQTESAVRESEVKYRALFESSLDGIFLIEMPDGDEEGVIVDCNEAACLMNGYTREELIGRKPSIFCPSGTRLKDEEFFAELLNGESAIREFIHRRKDGTMFLIESITNQITLNGKQYLLGIDRDITARKHAEASLRESEAKYRTLFDSSIDGIILIDIQDMNNWKIADCNEAACNMNGYSREELINHSLDIFHITNMSADDSLEKLTRVRKAGFITEELFHRHKNGIIFPIENTSSIITIGGKSYILGIDRDISERKWAERALRESEEKYRSLVENAEVAIYTVNSAGEILFMNRVALDNLGWTSNQMKRKTIWDAFSSEYAEQQMEGIRRVITTGKGRAFETDTVMKHESRRYRTTIQRMEEEKSTPMALVIAYDITRQKKAESELAAEKERLAVTLSSIGEGVIATDVEGNIVLVNQSAEHLTDWTAEEAIGRPIREILRTRTVSNEDLGGAIGDISEDVILIARNGLERNITENGATIRDAKGNALGMVFVFRDVTRQRKNEQELLKIQKLESVGVLAGGIAHDFNNIMTSLLLNVQLCKILSAQRADIGKNMTDMEKAIMRATNLTGQLLTFARGGAPVKKRLFIDELIRETVEFTLHGLQSACRFIIEENLPLVEADEGQIGQVMNNLILNADQAMPNGGIITVRVQSIRVDSHGALPLNPGWYIKIVVEDQGTGIAKENLSKIFDPYFTTKPGGNGLGLASSYSIIKGHHGYIDVESTQGKGAVFAIYLPAIQEDALTIATETEGAKQGGGRVLLMDDDEAIRMVVGEALGRSGFKMALAANGEEAIRKFNEAEMSDSPFDAVVLDLTIPGGIGGLEVLEKLRLTAPSVKAIVASGYSNSPVMANYQQFGFCGVITKPFKIESLIQTLNQIIGDLPDDSSRK